MNKEEWIASGAAIQAIQAVQTAIRLHVGYGRRKNADEIVDYYI